MKDETITIRRDFFNEISAAFNLIQTAKYSTEGGYDAPIKVELSQDGFSKVMRLADTVTRLDGAVDEVSLNRRQIMETIAATPFRQEPAAHYRFTAPGQEAIVSGTDGKITIKPYGDNVYLTADEIHQLSYDLQVNGFRRKITSEEMKRAKLVPGDSEDCPFLVPVNVQSKDNGIARVSSANIPSDKRYVRFVFTPEQVNEAPTHITLKTHGLLVKTEFTDAELKASSHVPPWKGHWVCHKCGIDFGSAFDLDTHNCTAPSVSSSGSLSCRICGTHYIHRGIGEDGICPRDHSVKTTLPSEEMGDPATTHRQLEAIGRKMGTQSGVCHVIYDNGLLQVRYWTGGLIQVASGFNRDLVIGLSTHDWVQASTNLNLHGEKLTFETLSHAIDQRSAQCFAVSLNWTLAQWTNALAGEVGEACNWVKKMDRGDKVNPREIGKELADVVIYAHLAAKSLGLRLEDLVVQKFNEVSDRVKSTIKL